MNDQTGNNRSLTQSDSDRLWDIAVIGAGPAGSVCAKQLATAGFDVLLIDKEQFPRHKPCGDLLIPDALTVLSRLGLLEPVADQALSINTIRVYSPSGISFKVPAAYLTLSRKRLDFILANEAAQAGAEFRFGWVKEIVQNDQNVTLTVADRTIKTRIAVIATGANVELAEKLDLVSRSEPSAVAIRQYIKSNEHIDEIILSYDKALVPGYAWVMPLPDGWYNLGCGVTVRDKGEHQSNLKGMLKEYVRTFEPAARIMATAESISPINGSALRTGLSGLKSPVSGRVICIGETAGTTFPFTGEGIGKAIHTAELAAGLIGECITRNKESELVKFESILNSTLRPLYRGYSLAERWLAYPRLNDYFARRICRSRFLQSRVEEFMNETADPSRLYSPWTLAQSYWK